MDNQANQLRRMVEDDRQKYISQLHRMDYFHTTDGKAIETLTHSELKQILANVTAIKRREEGDIFDPRD